jgi:hypothetical protein
MGAAPEYLIHYSPPTTTVIAPVYPAHAWPILMLFPHWAHPAVQPDDFDVSVVTINGVTNNVSYFTFHLLCQSEAMAEAFLTGVLTIYDGNE